MNTSTTMSSSTSRTVTVVDPKMSLSLWLRTGRGHKGLSLADVAKITKIQPRILERLETGKLEGLPADVFVRGFVRSYARCVGLDEGEALQRYSMAAGQPIAPTAAARALVESMSELAPTTATRAPKLLRRDPEVTDVVSTHAGVTRILASGSLQDLPKADTVVEMLLPATGTLAAPAESAEPAVIEAPAIEAVAETPVLDAAPETAPTVEPEPAVISADAKPTSSAKKKRGKGRGKRRAIATGTPWQPMPFVEAAPITASSIDAAPIVLKASAASDELTAAPAAEAMDLAAGSTATLDVAPISSDSTAELTATWAPKMPTVVTTSVPWRRPFGSSTAPAALVPTLVIDDADPDSAERELEDRAAAKEPARRSFLPPILLDREDRSARQGGLTLAVIILLIAATLTLSYLMRRPSSTGDGVTQADAAHDILA